MKRKIIFKIPTYHPQHKITFEDLQTTVAVYDPALLMAPLKPGHQHAPGTPAFAWFKEIAVDTKRRALVATLDPALLTKAGVEAIKSGNYKHLSPEFYSPDSPYNPVPGTFYFKGLAYLGAEQPAGKGLSTISATDLQGFTPPAEWTTPNVIPFREGENGDPAIIFDQEKPSSTEGGQVKRKKLLELIQSKAKGVIADDKVSTFAEEIADAIFTASPQFEELNESSALSFAERIIAAELKAAKAEAEAAKAKADAEKQAATFAEQTRRTQITTRVEAFVAQGRIPPKRKDEVIAFGMALPSDETSHLEFADKDGKQSKRSLFDTFCAFIEEYVQPVKANLDEIAKDDGRTLQFSDEEKKGKDIADRVNPQKS